MASPDDMHALLEAIDGIGNLYGVPPAGNKMEYPCTLYLIDDRQVNHADNKPYNKRLRFTVTHISRDPLSPVPDRIMDLPYSSFDRQFRTNDLQHDVFNVFL